MKLRYTCKVVFAALGLLPGIASAQRYFGIANSAWSGSSGLYLNPASIADAPDKLSVDLFSANFGLESNTDGVHSGRGLHQFFNGDSSNISSLFKFNGSQTFNVTAPYAELRGPSVIWRISPRHSVAFSTRLRGFNQYNNFDQKLYRTIVDEEYRKVSGNYALNSGRFSWNAHVWSEIGLSYAAVLYDRGPHMLKGGISLRYLGGFGYLNLNANNIDAAYNSKTDTLSIRNTDVSFSSNLTGNTSELSDGLSGSEVADYFLGNKGGKGFGADLGLVYEYRPGAEGAQAGSGQPYKFRFTASVTDIGSVRYSNNNKTAFVRGNGSVNATDLANKVNNFTQFRNYLSAHGIQVDSNNSSTRISLPTSLILGVDYQVHRHFFANLTYVASLTNGSATGNSYFNQLTLTPRYDTRLLSVGMPITYSMLSRQLKMGLGVRVSRFFIGSDDLLAFTGLRNQKGLNLYLSAGVPLGHAARNGKAIAAR